MRQEHIDKIQAAINELTLTGDPSQLVRLPVLRGAFEAIFEHLCQHEENHTVVGGESIDVIAAQILAQSPPGLDRRSTAERTGARNIEP